MYDEFGIRVQQSPAYAEAACGSGDTVLVAASGSRIAAFAHSPTKCTALGGDLPMLGPEEPNTTQLVSLVSAVRRVTGLPVYLPLVDQGYAGVAGCGEFLVWHRPPNSVIDWTQQGRDLPERVRRRGTSQVDRKRRRVERDGLVLDVGRSGDEAAQDMLTVDDRSWKAARGQSMRARNQWDLYGRLLRTGTLTATFLRDGQRPIAFRLDGRIKDRVTCVKWSYDESYRRYSPGLYLLTEGLTRQWGGTGVGLIDLFGGPDTLKDLLYTSRIPRVDVWCGDSALGDELARDRLALDSRTAQVRDDGKGLRHVFG
ncbi:GNAT family N-acetyltransferase [Nocardia gipuzkoensis]